MSNPEIIVVMLLPIGLIAGGILVAWYGAVHDLRSDIGSSRNSATWSIFGGFLVFCGLIALLITTTLAFAVIAIPVAAVVLIIFLRRYFDSEQQSLLWCLLTAAERGIPLNVAAEAFANERKDFVGRRAAHLADYLEAGVPLGLALRRSGYRFDSGVALAADLGYQTGTVGPALRQVLNRSGAMQSVTIPLAARLIYLGVVAASAFVVQTFLLLKILPVLERLYFEQGVMLPTSTQRIIAATEPGTMESFVWLALFLIGFCALFFGAMSLFGSLRRLPILGRLWWRMDCALVLRWLATGVEQGRPILDTLRLLAGYFPHARMRRALERAATRIEQGAHWSDSLFRSQLIRRSENAVFRSAERAGNLQWALQEMSDSSVRRWVYQLQVVMSVLIPFLLIMLSGGVLAVVLGFFTPLISLIQAQT